MQAAAAARPALSIGALAKHAGTKVQTIRYYEQIGLISHAKCLRPDHGDMAGGAHPRA